MMARERRLVRDRLPSARLRTSARQALFDTIERFADYTFNKSHATGTD